MSDAMDTSVDDRVISEDYFNDESVEQSTLSDESDKRKRINKIKLFIVFGVLIIILVSVILNLVLIFKVVRLEQRMEHLISMNNYSAYIRQI
ncbi:MAG: hypothetical protein IJ661_08945 [Lachnospiraceae bacterium]|nr:hypothetical protein [Lachnospiraceae bacterium]